jgi:hypothetical protein
MNLLDVQPRYEIFLREVLAELVMAEKKFPPFENGYESCRILVEKADDVSYEVMFGTVESRHQMAIQVAAVALRFVHDVCGPSELDPGPTVMRTSQDKED